MRKSELNFVGMYDYDKQITIPPGMYLCSCGNPSIAVCATCKKEVCLDCLVNKH